MGVTGNNEVQSNNSTQAIVGQGGIHHSFKKPGGLQQLQQEVIVIHVFDENRKVNKDFTCEKELLVTHMKYFEKYLTEATSVDDIDISVHCDIKIFEWLMKYLKLKDQGGSLMPSMNDKPQSTTNIAGDDSAINGGPKLDIKNVISILISSDFLQMKGLVQECIDFVISIS